MSPKKSLADGNKPKPYVHPVFEDEDVMAVYDILEKESNIKGGKTDTKGGTITIVRPESAIEKKRAELRDTSIEQRSRYEMELSEAEQSYAMFRRCDWAAVFKALQVPKDGSMEWLVLKAMNEDMKKRACIDDTNNNPIAPTLTVSHLMDECGNAFLKLSTKIVKGRFPNIHEVYIDSITFWAKLRTDATVRGSLTDREEERLMSQEVGNS